LRILPEIPVGSALPAFKNYHIIHVFDVIILSLLSHLFLISTLFAYLTLIGLDVCTNTGCRIDR